MKKEQKLTPAHSFCFHSSLCPPLELYMAFFFPFTFVSDGKFLIQHTGFVPIWKWKGNTFALRYTEGHLLKPRQSSKVHLPAARVVARGKCICPFSPNGSLRLSRSDLSNIATFAGVRKKKKKEKPPCTWMQGLCIPCALSGVTLSQKCRHCEMGSGR